MKSAATIERLQQQRLKKLLNYASQHSSFYRKRLNGVLSSSGPIDLALIPPTTKKEMQEQFDDVVTDPRLHRSDIEQFVQDESNLGKWYLGEYAASHTSGSQGSPLLIVQNRHAFRVVLATMSARCRPAAPPSVAEGIRKLIRPSRVAVISFKRGFYPSGVTIELMQEYFGPLAKIQRYSSFQPDLLDQLNKYQPQVISGYASVLEGLAIQHDRIRLNSLEHISNSSEQLTDRARKRIENAFGVPVFDHYGAGECLQLADGCRHCGGLHINADWAILESVDDDYRPVPAGETGSRILVTNLANFVQPFIRYEIPDRVALHPPGDNCPNRLPRIKRIEGRSAELFWVDDNGQNRFVSGVLFHSAIDALQIVHEWKAIQRERNLIELHLQFLPEKQVALPEIENRLTQKLHRDGLPRSVQIRLIESQELTADPATGKMQRMITTLLPVTPRARKPFLHHCSSGKLSYRVLEIKF